MKTNELFLSDLKKSEKKSLLSKAISQLKKEYVGIDGILDELADSMMSWWLFPEFQRRPLIINLWGMTGSGKTAVLVRLAELLQYNKFLMRFDMGEYGAQSSFLKYTLTRQLLQYDQTNPIILLDEFQFAKTIDEAGKEVNNNSLRVIWDLLDSGQLFYEPDTSAYYHNKAKQIIRILETLIKRGVKIKKGRIIGEAHDAAKLVESIEMGYHDYNSDTDDSSHKKSDHGVFTQAKFCTGIVELSQGEIPGWKEVSAIVSEMNSIEELLSYVSNLVDSLFSFKKMDLSKAILFVVGNLDEAYVISHSINPDIDADEYRRFTQKITVADIKTALQRRFRNEQIARLGNNHLIYHSFAHKDFESLIQLYLNNFRKEIKKSFGFKIDFTKNVNRLIYEEGVFPTQGVRPVISTFRNLIESNFAKIVLAFLDSEIQCDKLLWDFRADEFYIRFLKDSLLVHEVRIKINQKINSLRKSVQNDKQAMVAVHESGHALIAALVVKILPEYVISRTADSESEGFTLVRMPEEVLTSSLILDKIMLNLGGYVAEEMIFGKEHKTTGVSGDLQTVSNLSHQYFREYGMSGLPYKINIHSYGGNPYQFTYTEEIEKNALKLIEDCINIVTDCLTLHKSLLIELSRFLSDHSRIDKSDLEKMINNNLQKRKMPDINFKDQETYYNFRERLFKM